MKASEIRSKFLKYFEKNGHSVISSSSLIPSNDPTLLFTNAGMVQFKDVFLGKDQRPYTRATTSQKVVRAGGKHNDLENVGFTARHHTFFEMLGNFSFGDYFKREAIHYAWEFITQELKLPKDRLYVTVFEKDDEAATIWHEQENVPKDRIYRFGEKDNFWSMGDTGPCGPCTEIFYDRGTEFGCGKSTCKMGCDCDRYTEFWNLVFMQFNRDTNGTLTPLPKPSVDTGAGLERIAMILQNAATNYDTDAFQEIIQKTAKLSGIAYDPTSPLAPSFRVIADHARATTFLISDGVMPSNEGRGYVLRRIMRRAIRHGKKLEFTKPFFAKACAFVIDQMKDAYPELLDQRALIEKAVQAEEELFLKTLDKGLGLIAELLTETGKSLYFTGNKLNGDMAFKLYDTYGFPLDLTRVILEEKGLGIDEAGFEKAMDHQRSESRKNWKGSGDAALDEVFLKFATELRTKNQLQVFTGYEKLEDEGTCIGLFQKTNEGFQAIEKFQARHIETPLIAFFANTPFYAESGGQVGDRGQIDGNGVHARVVDVTHPVPELIAAHIEVLQGILEVGKKYQQTTEALTRALTARNHTATHILHWALREVLGKHVKQAGSLVTPELLRFDFSHFQALTHEELEKIELLINEKIWHGFPVAKKSMSKDQAISEGAIAFFGEKYGDEVRVIKVGDFSVELCGGTHVDQSSDIHLFKIESEGGIAAGVRRIIARTSKGAFQMLRERSVVIDRLRENLKAGSIDDILVKLEKAAATEKELRKQIEKLEAQAASQEVRSLIESAKAHEGVRIIAHILKPTADGMKKLRALAEVIQAQAPDAVAWLGVAEADGSKASLIALAGKEALKLKPGFSAQKVIQASASFISGKGGGKPDLAQAGGTQASGLQAASDAAQKAMNELLK